MPDLKNNGGFYMDIILYCYLLFLCSRVQPSQRSGSQPKVHKLGSTAAGGNHQSREPDSMLLQKSWGISSTGDVGTLQNVR